MRDVDRLKEKIELSLDNRQVVSLVIGSLLVLGVVFLLGVMVGKQVVPASTATAPTQDVLAVLDQQAHPPAPAAKPIPKPVDPPLTFPAELTNPSPPAPTPVRQPPAEPKPDAKSELVPEHAVLVPPPSPSPVPQVEAKAPPAVPKAETPKPAPAKPAAPPVADHPEHTDSPAPSLDQKLAAAFTAAKASPHTEEASAVVPPKPGSYTVQVAASQQKSDADQVMTKLRGSGLRPYQVNADIPGRGLWYRVRVGSFPTRGDAEKYASDLKRETGMVGFVTSASQ